MGNKWLIRIAGFILILMGIGFGEVFGARELFKILNFSITGPEIIIILGLITMVAPNNDDVINVFDKLSKAGTRLLLAKAGINYDATRQENSNIVTSDQQKSSDQTSSNPPSQG